MTTGFQGAHPSVYQGMISSVLTDNQVSWAIIGSIFIYMMRHSTGREGFAQSPFSYKNMLSNVTPVGL